MEPQLENIFEGILEGDMNTVAENTEAAIEAGIPADRILHGALIPAMDEVGRLFEEGEYFVPEMLIAARAMQKGLNILKPRLVEADVEPIGKVVAGTVQGDLHDIGKNLVCMMMEGAGFEIIDLGTNVSPERFVEAVKNEKADLVALSALLTTTMSNMGATIRALQEAGVRDQVKVMVGGAPVDAAFAERIGADGYGSNAPAGSDLAKKFVGAA